MNIAKDITIWGIHSGRYGEANNLFLEKKRIAFGWTEMANAGQLKSKWSVPTNNHCVKVVRVLTCKVAVRRDLVLPPCARMGR